MTDDDPLPAGDFSTWLRSLSKTLGGGDETPVPCGECSACCRSSQFVHIAPDELATVARIPPELTFAAPAAPEGHVLLGYDEPGRCPMLGPRGCSIYDDRPRTCRVYDCRVFAAAMVEPDDDKPLIAQRSSRWTFGYLVARNRTELAVQAVEVHAALLDDRDDAPSISSPFFGTVLDATVARGPPAMTARYAR